MKREIQDCFGMNQWVTPVSAEVMASSMEHEDPWARQENTIYNYEELGKPSESKAELEKQRDQLKIKIERFDQRS